MVRSVGSGARPPEFTSRSCHSLDELVQMRVFVTQSTHQENGDDDDDENASITGLV